MRFEEWVSDSLLEDAEIMEKHAGHILEIAKVLYDFEMRLRKLEAKSK